MTVRISKLSQTIGAAVTGLSGHQLVDKSLADDSLAALDEYGVLVFPQVNADDDDLVAFSRLLGEVVILPRGTDKDHPEISKITRDPSKSPLAAYREGTFYWHIDGTTDEIPNKATLLTARDLSDDGTGDTEFASTYAAYDSLPERERAKLEGVRVVHSFAASQLLVHPDPTPEMRAVWAGAPSNEHPLVWTRKNERRSMLLGATAESVVGMDREEGRAWLDRLLEWATQPKFVLRHRWSVGDLVIWDNTGMLHRAEPYGPESRRLMHRTTLVGEEAVA